METLLIKSITIGNKRIHLRYDDRKPDEEVGMRWLIHSYFLKVERGKGMNILEDDVGLVNYLISENFYDFLYELVEATDTFVKDHESYEVASKVSEMTQAEKLTLTFDLQHLYGVVYTQYVNKLKENPYGDFNIE